MTISLVINMRRVFAGYVMFIAVFTAKAQVLEMENGTLTGTVKSTQRPGYSGSGYVTGFDNDGDGVSMKVYVTKGVYNLYVRYAAPSGQKFNFIHVNDQNVGSAEFPSTSAFAETHIGKVFLKAGENTIAIVKDWGYFEVDNIRLEPTAASAFNNVDPDLVTPSPSPEADSLYTFLSSVYGKVILSGQYGGTTEFNKIKTVSGKTPAMRGFDLIDYSPSRVAFGASSNETENAIGWHQQRGIVTFAWHWNAPKDLINQPGKEWWRGFYTEATTFDVTKAMNNPASEEYTLILRDIDAIAVQLKELQDANIPVLWRPLHEAEGMWFWWGAKGPEPCKWLWKLVFERLVNHHQLNNLIWVWTSTGTSAAIDWYPGDAYVDIIGADIYLPAGNYSSNFMTFDNIAAIYAGKKIITLSENGPIPDPESLFYQDAAWSWFCTWSGSFITDGSSNTTAHINKVYNHEYVITLDEIDEIDAIIESLAQKKAQQDEDDNVLSVDETDSQAIIYQNPIKENRLILTTQADQTITTIEIYDVHGSVELLGNNINLRKNERLEFSFENKGAGIYLLKVATPESVKIFRVIKI